MAGSSKRVGPANPAPQSGKRHGYAKKAHNLLERLDHHRADVLRSASDFRASWDNNLAERDVRMVKVSVYRPSGEVPALAI